MSLLQEMQQHGLAKCECNDLLIAESKKPFFAVFDNFNPQLTTNMQPSGGQTFAELSEKAKEYQRRLKLKPAQWCMPRVYFGDEVIGFMQADGSLFKGI